MLVINHKELNINSLDFEIQLSKEKGQQIYYQLLQDMQIQSLEDIDKQKLESLFQRYLVQSESDHILKSSQKKVQEIRPGSKIADFQIDTKSFDYNFGEVRFKARIELLPKINLSQVRSLRGKDWLQGFMNMSDDLEKYIKTQKVNLLLQFSPILETFDKIKKGSFVTAKVQAFLDKKNITPKSQEIQDFVIGLDIINPEIEKALVGKQTGDRLEVALQDSQTQEQGSKNKEICYKIEILSIKKLKYTNLEDLYQSLDGLILKTQASSILSLEKFLEKEYLDNLATRKKTYIIQQISAELLKAVPPFDLPTDLIKERAKQLTQKISLLALSKKLTLKDAVYQIGFNFVVENQGELEQKLEEEIYNQMRYSYIIQDLFLEIKEIQKPTQNQIQKMAEIIAKNPQSFGINYQISHQELFQKAKDNLNIEAIYLYFTT